MTGVRTSATTRAKQIHVSVLSAGHILGLKDVFLHDTGAYDFMA
jgi:hypothetical protein